MSQPHDHQDAGAPRRMLRIDLEELTLALDWRDPLGICSHWLNLESGEIRFLGEAGAEEEDDEDPRDNDNWLRVEAIESWQAFAIMEDFVEQCADTRVAHALSQALQQRKPFRRFKDTLIAHTAQREAWFAFERQAMEAIARRWCEDHGISPSWIPRSGLPSP